MTTIGQHAPGGCPACTGYSVSVDGVAITDDHGYLRVGIAITDKRGYLPGRIVASVEDAFLCAERVRGSSGPYRVVIERLGTTYADEVVTP